MGTRELHLQRSREVGVTCNSRPWAISSSNLLTLTSFSSLPGIVFEVLRQAWIYCKENIREFILGMVFPSWNLYFQARFKAAHPAAQWGGQDFQEPSFPVVCYIPNSVSAFQSCEKALGYSLPWLKLAPWACFQGPAPSDLMLQVLDGNEWQRQDGWLLWEHHWCCSLWHTAAYRGTQMIHREEPLQATHSQIRLERSFPLSPLIRLSLLQKGLKIEGTKANRIRTWLLQEINGPVLSIAAARGHCELAVADRESFDIPLSAEQHSHVWRGRWELRMSCWGFAAACPHSSPQGVLSVPAHDKLSAEFPAAELHLSPEPGFGLMPEKSLLEERDEYLVNGSLMNPIRQVGGTQDHLCIWCTKHQCGTGKIITGGIVWQHYPTLFMWNQLKREFNLPSDAATSKSQNVFLFSVFICFWQRCNSKKWTTFITWCVWSQTGEFLDKPIHFFKDLIRLSQNQQLRQKHQQNRGLEEFGTTGIYKPLQQSSPGHYRLFRTRCFDSHRQ